MVPIVEALHCTCSNFTCVKLYIHSLIFISEASYYICDVEVANPCLVS